MACMWGSWWLFSTTTVAVHARARSPAPLSGTMEFAAAIQHVSDSFEALADLATDSQLSDFAQAEQYAHTIEGLHTACVDEINCLIVFGIVRHYDVIATVGRALAKGWQLVTQQFISGAPQASATAISIGVVGSEVICDSVMPGYGVVQSLSCDLSKLLLSVDEHCQGGDAASVFGMMAEDIAASGLLDALVSLATTVTSALHQYQQEHCGSRSQQKPSSIRKGFFTAKPKQQPQQQPQQQIQHNSNPHSSVYMVLLANLACELATLHLAVGCYWVGRRLSCKTFACTVVPMAKLTAALLQARAAFATGVSSSSGNSSSSSDVSGLASKELDAAAHGLVYNAAIMAGEAGQVVPVPTGPVPAGGLNLRSVIPDQATIQVMESPEFLQMIAVSFCAMTASRHQQQQGKSHVLAVNKVHGYLVDWSQHQEQRLCVPAYHKQCFDELHVSDASVCSPHMALDVPGHAQHHLWALAAVLRHQMAVTSTHNSNTSTGSASQHDFLRPKLLLALLRVVVELLLLCSDPAVACNGIGTVGCLFDFLAWGAIRQQASTFPAAVAAIQAAAGPTAVRDLISDMVLLLGPVALGQARQAIAAAPADPAASAAAAWQPASGQVWRRFTTITHNCVMVAESATNTSVDRVENVLPAFFKQPGWAMATLEATSRTHYSAASAVGTHAADVRCQAQQMLALPGESWLMLVRLGSADKSVTAEAAASVLQPLPYAFSALISALKCCRQLHVSRVAYRAKAAYHWQVLSVAAQLVPQPGMISRRHRELLQATSSSSRLHGARNGVSGLVPWTVATSRALVVVGEQLRDLATLSAHYIPQDTELPAIERIIIPVLKATIGGVDFLQKQLGSLNPAVCLSTAAAEGLSRITELQQQARAIVTQLMTQLQLLLSRRTEELTEASATALLTSSLGLGLSQLLIDLGSAACVALPLPYCCNNPWCENVSMLSELELVGGKGCVCAGCQVARYCGRECQLAHRKQHKVVCRKLQASR